MLAVTTAGAAAGIGGSGQGVAAGWAVQQSRGERCAASPSRVQGGHAMHARPPSLPVTHDDEADPVPHVCTHEGGTCRAGWSEQRSGRWRTPCKRAGPRACWHGGCAGAALTAPRNLLPFRRLLGLDLVVAVLRKQLLHLPTSGGKQVVEPQGIAGIRGGRVGRRRRVVGRPVQWCANACWRTAGRRTPQRPARGWGLAWGLVRPSWPAGLLALPAAEGGGAAPGAPGAPAAAPAITTSSSIARQRAGGVERGVRCARAWWVSAGLQ